ncbi:hypothetical protein Cni_G05445 [Canna indica]|uniref:Late embryogenesis abundant protein LEA-2 subgroup domain-containing protein n=1 Tax=Canna indica TaxID=4628 RepID=A0AAQ3JUS7_9LILI|nr:hypothetical protein Cni_G05445 [Canna indica]
MKESGDANGAPLDAHRHKQLRRRRRRRLCCFLCLFFLALLIVAAVVLALTVFKIREPQAELVSVRVAGVSPRVILPAMRLELNLTLDLSVLVHNPNYAAFSHADGGLTHLFYRGTQVGEATVAPGRIPSRGSELLRLALAVDVDRIAAELGDLIADVLAGAVAFDTDTRLPGRVTILGFVKRHAVATSKCHVVFGVSDLKVRSQDCTQSTKL